MAGEEAGDELIERLLPKIFDDVTMKKWQDYNGNIDLDIILEFLKLSFEPVEDEERIDIGYLFTQQKERIHKIQNEVETAYLEQLERVKEDLKEKPMTEKRLIDQLLTIRNTALLRLQTCAKFCFDSQAADDLEEHLLKVKAYFIQQFRDIIAFSSEVAQKAAQRKIDILFAGLDQEVEDDGYKLHHIQYLASDLKEQVFGRIPKKFSENQLGSERSHALISALSARLPSIY